MSNKQEKNSSEAQGFLSHLIELRDRLLRAVIAVGVVFFALFPFAKTIYNWLAAPLANQGQQMIITGTIAPFLVPMKLTLLVAFLITLPYLLYQLWSFVAPGLYRHEKRLVYPLLASSVLLFYLGILFVYYILLPMMFSIIPQFAPDVAVYSPDISQYLDFSMMMFLAFGFGFEMPIATILLISTGMTTAESLKKKRPYVIVGAFILGMLLTPPDVVSQVMLAIPMWLLFELGLYFSKYFKIRIKEAGEARENMDGSEDNTGANNSASSSAVLQADDLWAEDDQYTYHEDNEDDSTGVSDEERTILNPDSDNLDNDHKDSDKNNTEEETFFDNDDFDELSDEEMEAELDRIEAQEQADELVEKKAKKRAKKKAKAKKKAAKKKQKKNKQNKKDSKE